jgi:transcriptional regulator with XRE-family HTH domain
MAESPICKRLKEARLAAGISQKNLGIAAGMDEFSASSRMNHYEIGRHTPDYSTLKRIAKVLKLPVAYFYAESDELAALIKLFYQLKKSEKTSLLHDLMPKESSILKTKKLKLIR